MKRYIYRIFLILAFLFMNIGFVKAASISNYYSYGFDSSEGLSSNTVFKILKWGDFVWMSTRQGVDMYNGYSFKHYNLFSDDIRTLGDGQKISVHTDEAGNLWAYTDSGQIYLYDIKSDRFQLFVSLSDYNIYPTLNALLQISTKLYACTSNGILCIDMKTKRILYKGLDGLEIRCGQSCGNNFLLVGGVGGVFTLTHDLKISKRIPRMDKQTVETLYVDSSEDCVWMGCEGSGLWVYEQDHLSQVQGPFQSAIVRSIRKLDDKYMLIGCDGMGVYKVGVAQKEYQLFASDVVPAGTLSLRTSSVYDILVDEGNIWVTSYLGGVTLLRKGSNFVLVKDEEEKVSSANFVHGVCAGKNGDVWMAFNFYIGCYNYLDNTFRKFLDKQAGFLSVALDDAGFVWCGGYNSGVYRLNPRTGHFDFFPSLSGNKEKDCVFATCKDSLGNIWLGGMNFNLTKLTIQGEKFEKHFYNLKKVTTLLPIAMDSLLVGTVDGVYLMNIKTETIVPIFNSASSFAQWRGSTYINCVTYSAGQKEIWIGTDGGGLLCYQLAGKNLIPYTTREGLPSNYIMAIQADSLQRLWISTENAGLFVFDTKSDKMVSSLRRHEGLFFNEFFPGASCLLPNGNFAFGGYYGALVFSPLSASLHSVIRKICFTDLKVGSEEVTMVSHPDILGVPLNRAKELRIPYETRSLSLSISTDDLYNQYASQFRWRLVDGSEEWNFLDPRHAIRLTNLAPGTYTLQIKGEDTESGTTIERSVKIVVEQIVWLRWYMLLVYALVLCGFVYWGIMTYKNYMEKLHFEEKVNFFINVAHDIKTPLTLVAAPLDKLSKLIGKPDERDEQVYLLATARNSVRHLWSIVNQLMDLNKLNVQKDDLLKQNIVDLKQYVGLLEYDYHQLAEEKGLYFRVNNCSASCLVNVDAGLLNRILDNLLSNALKYTFEGGVTVNLRLAGNCAVIEVEDTGIGISSVSAKKIFRSFYRGSNAIDKSIPGSGVGLFFTYSLVKKIGGKLSFKSTLNVGSTFYLSLPLVKNSKQSDESSVVFWEKQSGMLLRSGSYSSNKETILLVEDNQGLCEYLFHALSASYNVLGVGSAEEGMEILQKQSVDLVISDVMMPGMRGDTFCKQLKNHIETSHIPVILLTANTDKETQTMGLSVGADDYITKPFDMEILELKIRNVFVSRRKLHSYYLSKMSMKKSEDNLHTDTKTLQSDIDTSFLQKIIQVIRENLSNSEFTVNDLCNAVALSRTLLYEKTRKLLGVPPNDLIREMRMKQAKSLLEEGHLSVSTVALQCGYPDVRYFSTVFKKYYGVSPSKVIPGNNKED